MIRRPHLATSRTAAVLLSLSLAACDAAGVESSADDDAPLAQVEAAAPAYDAPGPHEVIQVDNVGTGFGTGARDDTSTCKLLVPLLDNGKATQEELDTFSKWPPGMNKDLYTLFRPKTLEEGKKYPVITWGNGTCATPVGYDDLLKHLASHGYLVIGANNRQVSGGAALLKALDWLASENQKPGSELYGKVDLGKIGVTGHSQGSGAALAAATDRRILTAVAIEGAGGAPTHGKPLFYIAGDKDAVVSAASVRQAFGSLRGPGVLGIAKGVDHITPIREPKLIWAPITAWFKAHLEGDADAKAWFYGSGFSFGKDAGWTVTRKSIN